MKDLFFASGWNLVLTAVAVFLGWYFSYGLGTFLKYFSGTTGWWIDLTPAVGVVFGIPFLAVLFLSVIGRRWWQIWAIFISLPILWLILISGDFGGGLFFFTTIFFALSIGFVIRGRIKKFLPAFPIGK